ncbi:unnamed protein product, partial [Rotaria sordida]
DAQEEKLVIITTEINAKQKCLEMLANARKRSDLTHRQYEERIKLLSERIQNAENEKQAAVTKLNTTARDQHNTEELKLVRRDYKEKIRRSKEIENNELSTLRAQYTVCLKDGEYYKNESGKHTNELKDLRKLSVQLTRELHQEFLRHKQAKAREIATLKEVHLLCRQMRSARMCKTTKEMSAHAATIQQDITNAICHRKLIADINRDMSTVIDSREGTCRKHKRYYKRLSNAIVTSTINTHRPEDATSYLNSEISSCQQVLMEYDDDREQESIDELRYLLTKHIEQGFEADEKNELISYVDLLETILAEKEDIKLAATRL